MKFYSAGKGRVGEELHSKTFFFFFRGVWFCSPIPLDFNLLPTVQPKRPVSKCWERSPALAPARTQHLNLWRAEQEAPDTSDMSPVGLRPLVPVAPHALPAPRRLSSSGAASVAASTEITAHFSHCDPHAVWNYISSFPRFFPARDNRGLRENR